MGEVGDIESGPQGTAFTWRARRVELALAGSFHVANALGAATTALSLGVPEDVVVAGLQAAPPVPGRFEVVATPAPFTVVVDYAHTPDGLQVVLDSARELAGEGRVLCVFGCGGDRDRSKRPAMGAIAVHGADVAVLTSDNPRNEDPDAIIAGVLTGVGASDLIVRRDRAEAIAVAIDLADPGDVVVVAGKGHETEIEVGTRRLPFDDRQVAAAAERRRFGPEAGRGDDA
jgi:UDP-N-acetylmuramoyl-L-alanyl-D-glutamate--2,6-diaminopimelate ligase